MTVTIKVENMPNHQGAASSLAEILSMNIHRWCCWSLTWRVHLMPDHFETTIRESNSYPCRKLTYPHQPLEVWNNHHPLKRVPGCFLGGKVGDSPFKNHWRVGWWPRHGKPQASKDWNPWRSLRLGEKLRWWDWRRLRVGLQMIVDDSWEVFFFLFCLNEYLYVIYCIYNKYIGICIYIYTYTVYMLDVICVLFSQGGEWQWRPLRCCDVDV